MQRINEMLETVERVVMITAALWLLKWLTEVTPMTREIVQRGIGN